MGWHHLQPSLVLPPAGNGLERLSCPTDHGGKGGGNESVWEEVWCPAQGEPHCPQPLQWDRLDLIFFPLQVGFNCFPALPLPGPPRDVGLGAVPAVWHSQEHCPCRGDTGQG